MTGLHIVVCLSLLAVTYAYAAINKCMFCQTAVTEAEETVAQTGCSFLFRAKATMFCMSMDVEKYNLSDQCVPLLVNGCLLIQQNINNDQPTDPLEVCTSLQMC